MKGRINRNPKYNREKKERLNTAENLEEEGCPQKDSAEHEEYAGACRSFRQIWKERDSAQPEQQEKILDRRNLNRAFKRAKANKGAAGIDGMTVEETHVHNKKRERLVRFGHFDLAEACQSVHINC